MRLDHLLSREEVGAGLLSGCQGVMRKDSERGGMTEDSCREILVAMRLWGTPVPIPNTKVKTQAADGTLPGTARESRWLPDHLKIIPY